jgi:hypothetical protein
LNDGISLAGFVNDIAEFVNSGIKSSVVGTFLTVGSFLFGIRDMIVGHQSNDPGKELSGLIDAGSAVAGRVSIPVSIAAQIAKLYASFWVPITVDQQTEFLNFISQCAFKKNTDQLSSGQAQKIVNRYQGGLGLPNLLSDYSLYKSRGFWKLVGQSGCP